MAEEVEKQIALFLAQHSPRILPAVVTDSVDWALSLKTLKLTKTSPEGLLLWYGKNGYMSTYETKEKRVRERQVNQVKRQFDLLRN